jgi:hypothetical protein
LWRDYADKNVAPRDVGYRGPEGDTGAACSSQSGQNNLADVSTPDVYVPTFEPA